jgi:hypothetical protein
MLDMLQCNNYFSGIAAMQHKQKSFEPLFHAKGLTG